MKKLSSLIVTALILTTALALLLTSCGASTADTVSTDGTQASDTTDFPVSSEETSAAESPSDEASSPSIGSQEDESEATPEPAAPTTVDITDIYGTVTVPVNPQRVVALDNRTFQTLEAWGVKLAAAPKPIMPDGLSYKTDDSIEDIGTHNDPNLEVIAAVNPDLVIVGQRFAGRYDEIQLLVPNAAVISLNFDVSVNAESPGDNLVNGFKDFTIALGQIFDKNAEAAQLVAEFDASIANAKAAYNGTDTVMSVIVSGGNIGFSAPLSGRVWGPLYDIFGWSSSLYVDGASSDHQGDDISVEAIAQSNPDWLFVLDRDAATSTADGTLPATDVISNAPALQNITAVIENNIVLAPNDTYTNESIQTFTALFNELARAMAG